jgi:hypothetical protein
MGVIFIIFVALIIFEIYIRRDNFKSDNKKTNNSIFTKKQLIILISLIVVLPILTIIALQTGLLGYNSENIREEYKTDASVEDKGIYLVDQKTQEKIYSKLDKPMDEKITRAELNDIKEINDLKADDLGDLKHFKLLEKLEITWTNDDSLLPIQNLKNLKYLSIKDASNIDNIDPIANLESLEYLSIDSTTITNISPLENLNNLKELRLNMPQIRDLSPINKILNLEKLYINNELRNLDEI